MREVSEHGRRRQSLDDGLRERVRTLGARFLAGLEDLAARFPALVTEPRGRGFLLAFDLPTAAVRDDFLKRALARGVFASYTGSRSVRLRCIASWSESPSAIF